MCYTIVTGRGRGRHARGRNRAADFFGVIYARSASPKTVFSPFAVSAYRGCFHPSQSHITKDLGLFFHPFTLTIPGLFY